MKPTWLAIGMLVTMICIIATQLLPDKHPASKVLTMKWYQRLFMTWPGPLDVSYGVPIGLLVVNLPVAIIGVGLLAWAYEYFYYYKKGKTPGFEYEDVRDPIIGVLIGCVLRSVLH